MEDFYTVRLRGMLEAGNFLARLVASRIAARSHHHAYRRIIRPLEIAVAGAAVDRSFHRLEQIAFEAHQNGLRLGIAEAAVEFTHHGAARGPHQAATHDAFILRDVGLHT